jgi:adenylate kinase family enzyme
MGAPGSGKTTLAKAIGERYGVTVWDLDWVVYDGETQQERSVPDLERELDSVLLHADRITEGAYHQGA